MITMRMVMPILVFSLSLFGFPALTPPAVQAGQRIKGVSELTAPDALNNRVLDQFKAEVEKASGGLIGVDLFKGTVGPGKQLLEEMLLGSYQIVVVEKSLLTAYIPEVGALSLPYIFKSRDHVNKTLRDSSIGRTLGGLAGGKGIAILGWFAYSPRALATNRPVRQVSDMQGLKVRVMNDAVMVASYQAEGAIPVPISSPEMWLAMNQGTVIAADTTVTDGRDMKLPEVSKYLALTNTFHSIAGVYANKRWFDGLSPDLQKVVSDAARTAAAYADIEEPKLYESALRDWVKASEVLKPDLTGFRQAAAKIYPQYYQKFGKEIIEGILKIGEQYQ
jgi:TRAP-type transport system periplasmic protein